MLNFIFGQSIVLEEISLSKYQQPNLFLMYLLILIEQFEGNIETQEKFHKIDHSNVYQVICILTKIKTKKNEPTVPYTSTNTHLNRMDAIQFDIRECVCM